MEQGRFARPEVVARRLAHALRGEGPDGEGQPADAVGGLDGELDAVRYGLDRLGGRGAEALGRPAVSGVGADVQAMIAGVVERRG